MGKRVSNQNGQRPLKRLSSGSVGQKETDVLPIVSQHFLMHPFLSQALTVFDRLWDEHEDAADMLTSRMPTESAKQDWAHKLNTWFPPNGAKDYLKASWDNSVDGLVYLRPWHWSWEKVAGNRGCVNRDSFRNLVQSFLARGFMTDVLEGGIDLPVVTPPRPELGEASPPIVIDEGIVPAFSVHEVKGWSRAVAMHVALVCVEEAGIMDEYLKFLDANGYFVNYQTQMANYITLGEGQDEVDLNRGVFVCCNKNTSPCHCVT